MTTSRTGFPTDRRRRPPSTSRGLDRRSHKHRNRYLDAMTEYISSREFHDAVQGWSVIGDGACTFYPTGSFGEAVKLVQGIAQLPGIEEHKPDIDIRHDGVTVRLLTASEDWYGMSQRDVDLARRISATADELGLVGDPSMVQSLLVIPGSPKGAEVMPFWQAVLGYEPRPDSPQEDLVDPRNRGPGLWFEEMVEPRSNGGGAIHIAVWVPHERAEARLAAALAAGGRLVRDHAPAWWTLADSAGNEVDISTVKGRD